MKTKLTLTVSKHIIESAKRMARKNGISLSQLFEEIFKEGGLNPIKAEPQCAERLLQRLEKSESIPSQDDEVLIKAHVERKFT